jgi:hypothetical protein
VVVVVVAVAVAAASAVNEMNKLYYTRLKVARTVNIAQITATTVM